MTSPNSFLPLSLHKNMIRSALMGTIRRSSDSGGEGTEANDFIQCVDGTKNRSMNCGVWVWTVSAAKFILQRK